MEKYFIGKVDLRVYVRERGRRIDCEMKGGEKVIKERERRMEK